MLLRRNLSQLLNLLFIMLLLDCDLNLLVNTFRLCMLLLCAADVEILGLDLCREQPALDFVSLKHVLAVVVGATVFAFEGSTLKQYN